MSGEGFVAGEIRPNGQGRPPLFKVVHRRERDSGPNVRPCDHGEFVLDDKWNTVTCARCGEKLDPYAALRSYADWWSELELKQTMADRATKDLYAETLRKLARRRAATDEEREEIKNLVAMKWSHDVETLRVATHRIERAINARRA